MPRQVIKFETLKDAFLFISPTLLCRKIGVSWSVIIFSIEFSDANHGQRLSSPTYSGQLLDLHHNQ